jgi:hypothetical protein
MMILETFSFQLKRKISRKKVHSKTLHRLSRSISPVRRIEQFRLVIISLFIILLRHMKVHNRTQLKRTISDLIYKLDFILVNKHLQY